MALFERPPGFPLWPFRQDRRFLRLRGFTILFPVLTDSQPAAKCWLGDATEEVPSSFWRYAEGPARRVECGESPTSPTRSFSLMLENAGKVFPAREAQSSLVACELVQPSHSVNSR